MEKLEKNVKLFVESGISKKNKRYYKMYIDLGYTQKVLSFSPADIAEIFDMSVPKLVATFDTTENEKEPF